MSTHLHGDKTIINHHLLGEAEITYINITIFSRDLRVHSQVGADCGLVLVAEPLVDVLVHQRRLSHTAIAKNDDLVKFDALY